MKKVSYKKYVQMQLIDLDKIVLSALHLFMENKLPKLKLPYKKPLVVGSGNAAATGRVIFEDRDAVFADEGTYQKKLKTVKDIDGIVLVSASGAKHAPIIAEWSKKHKKHVTLITNTPHAEAEKYLDKAHRYDLFVFPKQTEPYTYNTSTYMGMILGHTHENPKKIHDFILKKVKPLVTGKNFKKYNAFYLIVPKEFDAMREFFLTKFDELFGPMLNGRVFTLEQTKHAKTVVPSDKELFISFGEENKTFGKHRLNIPLPKNADYGALMAIGYYTIGQIQKQHPPYFKRNIVGYTKKASKLFKSEIKPIVD